MTDAFSAIQLTSTIVSAYVSHNRLPAGDLPNLIAGVHAAIVRISTAAPTLGVIDQLPPEPAVPIKKSLTDDIIICLEDGKPMKTLKRHLRAKFDMSPEQYRAKWGLPYDYPMVAPAYARQRSELAKAIGLGLPTPQAQPEPQRAAARTTRRDPSRRAA